MVAAETKPRIVQIAERIQADIRVRRLKAGDAYLTTAEVARILRVSTSSANNGLQLLEQQGILRRRNKSGCVIAGNSAQAAAIERVHILVHQDHMRTEGLLADGLIVGLQGELSGAQILFNFLPQFGEEQFARDVIAQSLRQSGRGAFVLVRSGFSLQSVIAQAGVPAVVFGTPYRAVHGLASLDRDHAQAGRLLAARMLARGCRRCVVLMRESEWPGDFAFLDALMHELGVAGVPAGDIKIRHLPAKEEAIMAEMASLFSEYDGMTGVICRSEPLAAGVQKMAAKLKRARGVIVAVSDVYRLPEGQPPPFMHVATNWSTQQIGAQLGKILRNQAENNHAQPEQEIIPIRIA